MNIKNSDIIKITKNDEKPFFVTKNCKDPQYQYLSKALEKNKSYHVSYLGYVDQITEDIIQ